MSRTDDHIHEHASQRLAVRVTDNDFQRDVLDKLGRLEVKMDMLVGGAQPGRDAAGGKSSERFGTR